MSDVEAVTPIDPVQTIDVSDSWQLSLVLLTKHTAPKDPDLRDMMRTQLFQQTSKAAARVLNTARGLRQERTFQKEVAEHAVRQHELELLYYGNECEEARRAQILSKLQRRRHELDEAIQRLARADQDFGVVRGIIQRAGYPPFPIETSPAYFPLSRGQDDDDDSGSSCWGV